MKDESNISANDALSNAPVFKTKTISNSDLRVEVNQDTCPILDSSEDSVVSTVLSPLDDANLALGLIRKLKMYQFEMAKLVNEDTNQPYRFDINYTSMGDAKIPASALFSGIATQLGYELFQTKENGSDVFVSSEVMEKYPNLPAQPLRYVAAVDINTFDPLDFIVPNADGLFPPELLRLAEKNSFTTDDIMQRIEEALQERNIDCSMIYPQNDTFGVTLKDDIITIDEENQNVYKLNAPKTVSAFAIVCLSISDLANDSVCIHKEWELVHISVPYISSMLGLREAGCILKTLENFKERHPEISPDLLLVDGSGVLHSRRCGIAVMLGLLSGLPTIGVIKKLHAIVSEGIDGDFETKLREECFGSLTSRRYVHSICEKHGKNKVQILDPEKAICIPCLNPGFHSQAERPIGSSTSSPAHCLHFSFDEERCTGLDINLQGCPAIYTANQIPTKELLKFIDSLTPKDGVVKDFNQEVKRDMDEVSDNNSSLDPKILSVLTKTCEFENENPIPCFVAPLCRIHDSWRDCEQEGCNFDTSHLPLNRCRKPIAAVLVSSPLSQTPFLDPIYISVGNSVSLPFATFIVALTSKTRVPEPIRTSDLFCREICRKIKNGTVNWDDMVSRRVMMSRDYFIDEDNLVQSSPSSKKVGKNQKGKKPVIERISMIL